MIVLLNRFASFYSMLNECIANNLNISIYSSLINSSNEYLHPLIHNIKSPPPIDSIIITVHFVRPPIDAKNPKLRTPFQNHCYWRICHREKLPDASIHQRRIPNQIQPDCWYHVFKSGVEFASKKIEMDDSYSVKLQIWDTAGQESFRSIVRNFYRNCSAVFLVYNITK